MNLMNSYRFSAFSFLIGEAGSSSYNLEEKVEVFPPKTFYGKAQLDTKIDVSET